MRKLFLTLALLVPLFAVMPSAEAHVIRPVKSSQCQFDWRTTEGMIAQGRCFARYFGLKPDRYEGTMRCESGGDHNPHNRRYVAPFSGFYGGMQYVASTWEGIEGHYLPNVRNPQPIHGRYTNILTPRYIRERFQDGLDGWGPWPYCGSDGVWQQFV